MILFFLVACLILFSTNLFINFTTVESIDQRFYTSLKTSSESAITINNQTMEVYFDKNTLKNNLIRVLNKNLSGLISEYSLYINYYYTDLTPCNYACKTVNVRLVSEINLTCNFDKEYQIKIGQTNE